MTDIAPRGNERHGWGDCHSFVRIGWAEMDTHDGNTQGYGVYGVRGTEIFIQYEQTFLHGGKIIGKSILRADADLDPYVWRPRDEYTYVEIYPGDPEAWARRLTERSERLGWPRKREADAQNWAYTVDEANYMGTCITCLAESDWRLRPTFVVHDKGHPHVNGQP